MANFQWRDFTFACCQGDIAVLILRTVLYASAGPHSGPVKRQGLNVIREQLNNIMLTLLIIFVKSSVADVCRNLKHTSDLF